MSNEAIVILDNLIKDIKEKENDCYKMMSFCNKHKFDIECEAIRYAQQAYNNCWLEVSDARDEIVKIIKKKKNEMAQS